MGRNYTIYVRHPEFDKEANKSGLINTLLGKHYKDNVATPKKVIKNSKEAEEAIRETFGTQEKKLCKIHDVPLTDAGKCLQKGCKYA